MVNRMEELDRLHSSGKINKLNISQYKGTQQYISRSEVARPQGDLKEEIYENFYDIDSTITTSSTSNPNDPDAQINVGGVLTNVYNQEQIFVSLERNSPYLWVANDAPAGGATLFVIVSHKGGQNFSRERPIYPQQFKVYKNVYEIRLRSAGTGSAAPYRVTEYEIGSL